MIHDIHHEKAGVLTCTWNGKKWELLEYADFLTANIGKERKGMLLISRWAKAQQSKTYQKSWLCPLLQRNIFSQTLQCMTFSLYGTVFTHAYSYLHKPHVLKPVRDFCVHLQARSKWLDGHFPEGTTFHQETGLCSEQFQLKRLALLRSWQPGLDACLHVFLRALCSLTVWSLSLFNSVVSNLVQPEILTAALKLQESTAENGWRREGGKQRCVTEKRNITFNTAPTNF